MTRWLHVIVTKTVTGLPAGTSTARRFMFDVEVKLADGTGFSSTAGDVLFEGGKASFELANGGGKVLSDIPAGASYVVTEEPCIGYTSSSENAKGTITSGVTETAAFTNTYQPATLTINKSVVDGNAEGSFTFTLSVDDPLLTANLNVTGVEGENTLHFTNGVSDPFTLKLADGAATATIQGLPRGATYTLAETLVPGYTPAYSGDDVATEDGSAKGTLAENSTDAGRR